MRATGCPHDARYGVPKQGWYYQALEGPLATPLRARLRRRGGAPPSAFNACSPPAPSGRRG
eukprot:1710572-Prorocentrum_lima.AAC.1